MNTSGELRSQWKTPGDIFSLLLVIGGDTVQKALAQLVGIYAKPFANGPEICITPVAFSFGWVAYAFTSLMSVEGNHQLMPPSPDYASIVINCSNAFVRVNQSWALGRLLRDHESANEADPNKGVSLRIDIYDLGEDAGADVDAVWCMGWITIIIQTGISIAPWVRHGDWGIFMITLCGTILALVTGSLPQWKSEKWAGQRLKKRKVTCLTQGNGNLHVMVFIGSQGDWDIESLALAKSTPRKETAWIIIVLAALWTLLLISAAGLKEHTWFLVGVGGIGMLQNISAAGSPRKSGASNFHLRRHKPRSIIVGKRQSVNDTDNSDDDTNDSSQDWLTPTQGNDTKNVMGALMELEKTVPKAGLALLKVFFPGGLRYKKERIRYKRERKFWKRAFRTAKDRSSIG